jgi:tetratricopeptide (TPR) repeat protein
MTDPQQKQAAEDHYYAALDLYGEGKHDSAITEYKKALELDPGFTDALHGLTRAYQDINQLDDAIAVAHRIVDLDPEDVLAHTSLSILFQKKGMIAEAEAESNKARILGWKKELQQKNNNQPG